MSKNKLTDKQECFCQEYLIDLNATQAAIRVDYSEKTATEQGSRLLTNVNVQERISELKKERSERIKIEVDRVLKEIARVAFADPRELYDEGGRLKDICELDDDTAAIVSGVDIQTTHYGGQTEKDVETKKIRMWNKIQALELAGRHLVLFTDKQIVKEESYLDDLRKLSEEELVELRDDVRERITSLRLNRSRVKEQASKE